MDDRTTQMCGMRMCYVDWNQLALGRTVSLVTNLGMHESLGVSRQPVCPRLFRSYLYMELDIGCPCLTWGYVPEKGKIERNNVE